VRFLGASRRVISLEFNSYVRPPELGSKPAIDAGRALQDTRSRGRLQTECHRTAAAFPPRKSAGSPSPSGDAVQAWVRVAQPQRALHSRQASRVATRSRLQ